MRASEILRSLADLIDSAEQPANKAQQAIQAAPQQLSPAEPKSALIAVSVPKNDTDDSGVFVPPLQAKLEILKKSEGLPNVYDEECADEMGELRKRAGIGPAQQVASEDNDVLG
jgi:hypothetical protein